MTPLTLLTIGGLAVAVLALARQILRAIAARRTARARYFSAAAALFDKVTQRTEPSGFARLAGQWQGLTFDLQAVPDTLTFRKLPTLWVMVTLTEAQPVRTALHIMARPGQNDIFSRFGTMPVSVSLPPAFPEYCALRCQDAALLPPEPVITAQATLFDDPAVKELVIAPGGLRLVFLADEAERGGYLLFRDAEMGRNPIAADRLLPHLEALTRLARTLKRDAEKRLPVIRENHATTKEQDQDDVSVKHHPDRKDQPDD